MPRLKAGGSFPKTARLLKRRDFQFRPFYRFQTSNFTFLYTERGRGRMGISMAKKILKNAAARNRVRRLLRESFRSIEGWGTLDVHILGRPPLQRSWSDLKAAQVAADLISFLITWALEDRLRVGKDLLKNEISRTRLFGSFEPRAPLLDGNRSVLPFCS